MRSRRYTPTRSGTVLPLLRLMDADITVVPAGQASWDDLALVVGAGPPPRRALLVRRATR